ncbi:IS1595 family transposase [Spiroplasma endosymbiont of Virgichneumon dumeticola]|uniref:IS1595 family transposase n=1 Tax=Spiroplasma endosymbiont of Virgichneumon dumeticola TaxID=3139323 RepID=UPI0035C9149C
MLLTTNLIAPPTKDQTPPSLFNNKFGCLNQDKWITNQSTTDHKYYSYDTSHAIGNLSDGTPTRNAFLVDNNGNLTIDSSLNLSDADKSMLNNIQEQMNSHKQITTIKDSFNSYSKSIYSDSYFSGDNSSWKYLQFGGIENHINISSQQSANKVEHNNSLSETLGLYYIAKATRTSGGIDMSVANSLGKYFISKSSLKNLNDSLTSSIINIIATVNNVYNFLYQSPPRDGENMLYKTDFSPHVLVEGTMKLNEFNNTFQTEKQCLAYIASLKQSKCIRCSSFNLNTSNLRKMRCLKCHQTFSILTGTIFSKSQTPLISWFYLIFRLINTKHGIPSTDVAKELGVTLKTAWRMGHKIRSAIAKQEPQFIVEGIVQMDEMYLSHMGFKKQGRSLLNKTLIVGIYEKTTNNLIVKVLKNANSKNLLQFAINHISSKCDVHTDSWKGYRDLKSVFTKHETVNHQDGYVSKTGVNTNQIESVWKHIRRTFKTHIKVAKHHIHLYAKEAAYKFNNIPSFETVMLCLI